jgi:hypothetical protein
MIAQRPTIALTEARRKMPAEPTDDHLVSLSAIARPAVELPGLSVTVARCGRRRRDVARLLVVQRPWPASKSRPS